MDGGSLLVSRIAYVVLHIENNVQRIVKEIKIVEGCCMSRIMYLVLLISQKDYEPIRVFSLFLVDKFLVVSCVGWIWPVKCFERFASRRDILGNGDPD